MQGKLARPVWGWGPGAIPGPTPLFAGSPRGGRTAAVLFTLLAGAKRHELEPWRYLRDVIVRLTDLGPGQLVSLLPDHWKAANIGVVATS